MEQTRPRKALRTLLAVMIAAAALLACFFVARAVDAAVNSRTPPNGINEELYVDLNGARQWISIYGEDADNPVLLYLHGGPGSATSMFDYVITRKWADVYTVVTWDQRACGKSAGEGAEELSCSQLVDDGIALSAFLLEYLDARTR